MTRNFRHTLPASLVAVLALLGAGAAHAQDPVAIVEDAETTEEVKPDLDDMLAKAQRGIPPDLTVPWALLLDLSDIGVK